MIVEPCIDARPEHLIKQVTRVLEHMRVNAVVEGEAIGDDVYLVRSKVVSDQVGDCPRNASVRGRILGMCRSVPKRCPAGVTDKFRVAASGSNGGHRSPKVIGELRIPAADGRIGEAGPQNGHHAGGIHYAELVVLSKVGEGPGVLLAGMFGPEKSDFALRRSADRAVRVTEDANLVVVLHPNVARER